MSLQKYYRWQLLIFKDHQNGVQIKLKGRIV